MNCNRTTEDPKFNLLFSEFYSDSSEEEDIRRECFETDYDDPSDEFESDDNFTHNFESDSSFETGPGRSNKRGSKGKQPKGKQSKINGAEAANKDETNLFHDPDVDIDDDHIEESEGTDEEADGNNWKRYRRQDGNLHCFQFTVQNSGFQILSLNRPDNELGYFQLFFTDELLNEIVKATNIYAKEKIRKLRPLPKYSVWRKWKETNLKEIKALFGVIMNMALNPKSELYEYFSEEWIDKYPFFKFVFSRIRFTQLFWLLHMPMSTQPCRGRKIKCVTDYIDRKCREFYIPHQNIAIDESTVGFKGRVKWKCYNRRKPTKGGLRIYCLCSKSGYVSCFLPYYGKEATNNLIRPELPFTSRIVLQLVTTLLAKCRSGSGFHIFTDKFYTSLKLAEELRKMKIHLTGTVQVNRANFPQQLKTSKLLLYNHISYQKNKEIMALSYRDKRIITMLSTYHNTETELIHQITKGGERKIVKKPKVILDYVKNMGGVDTFDHYCGSYAFARKSVKWWQKLFFWLLEVALVNSYILWNIDRSEKNLPEKSHLYFRKRIVRQLVGDVRNSEATKRGRTSSSDDAERLVGKHFMAKSDRGIPKDCILCSDRKTPGSRKQTVYYCKTCTRNPGLCFRCFERYHTQKVLEKKI